MCIHQEHYDQLLALYPGLPELAAQEAIQIDSQPMPAAITVKQRGKSYLCVEIAFLYAAGDKLVPDHKMKLRVDLQERKAVPESIWFQGRGTQYAKQPKESVNQQIVNVIARRLSDWLHILATCGTTARRLPCATL